MTNEEKLAFNIRSEAEMRKHLASLSWEEKVASIERMNAASRIAREAMREALDAERRASGVS